MKRILASLVSVVMLLSMVIVPASASATLTPTVTVETVADEVEAGDTVTLKVEIANNPGFTNFVWAINYDTEKLDLKSINPTFKYEMPGLGEMDVPYIDNATVEGNIQTGKIGCMRANAFTKDGVLFTLTFDVKEEAAAVGGKATVQIEAIEFDTIIGGDYSEIYATYVPGSVTVAHICGNVTFVEGQTATCTVPGWNGYYKCTCGMLYVDRACQDVIEDLETWKTGDGKTTADHIYGDWTSNDEKHWKACACGEKTLEGDHQYDDDADTICNDCNYTRTTGGSTTGGSTTGGSTTGGSTTGGSTTGGSTTGGSTTGGSTTGGSTTGGSTTGGSTTGGSTTGGSTTGGSTTGGSTTGGSTTGGSTTGGSTTGGSTTGGSTTGGSTTGGSTTGGSTTGGSTTGGSTTGGSTTGGSTTGGSTTGGSTTGGSTTGGSTTGGSTTGGSTTGGSTTGGSTTGGSTTGGSTTGGSTTGGSTTGGSTTGGSTTGGSTTGGSTTGGSTTGGSTTGGSTTGGSTTGGSTTGGSTTGGSTTGGSTTGGSTTGGSTTGATTIVIDVNDITIASAGTYTGYALTPAVSVNGLTSSDFTVEYYNNINAGDGAYVVIKPVEGGNYTFAPVTKNFTINKAIITITAKNYQIKVGESAPVLDGTSYSVSGLLGADTLITKPTLAYNSTPDTSKTGTYSIVVSGATASENYKISYVNGSLVIVEADQPIINWYTLKFETNGGTAVPSVRVKENTVVTLSDYETSKDGYQFAGWYIDKALTQTFTFVTINSDMTVYAKWVALECKGDSDCVGNTFTDFDHTEWYHQGIDFVINNNLMVGMGNNKFEPHTISSRAMALTVLYRLEGKPAVSIENPFVDVENDQWYTDAIVWAASKGIVNGYGDGRFGTNDDMTREQMAKIMYNYAKYKGYDISTRASLASFTDADKINPWAVEEMKWAVSVGLIKGISTTELAPQGNAERCQLATVLMRFCNLFVK